MKKTLLYMLAGLLALTLITPLIVDNSLFFPFITGKAFFFRVVVECALALWLILVAMDRGFLPRRSPVLIAILAFIAIVGVANIFGQDFFRSFWSNFERMEGYIGLLHLGVYALMLMTLFQEERLRTFFLQASLAVSIAVALYGLSDLFTFFKSGAGSIRIDATFGNPIYLAIYGSVHVFLAAFLALRHAKKPLLLVCYFFAGSLSFLMLFLTLTRGTVLGFYAGAMFAALLIVVLERENKLVHRLALILLIGGLTFLAGFLAIRNTEFARNNPFLTRFATASFEDKTVSARFLVWGIALEGVKERPILGWGQENFSYVFDKYYDPRMFDQEQWFDRTHNVVFDWLIAGGIFGLLAHLALFGTAFMLIWKREKTDGFFARLRARFFETRTEGREPFSASEKAILTGLLIAYFVHNLFVFDNLMSAVLFFILLAYIHARSEPSSQEERERTDAVAERAALTMIAPLVIVGAACAVYFLNMPAYSANRALIEALSSEKETRFSERNVAAFEKAASFNTLGRQEITERILNAASDSSLMPLLSEEEQRSFITFARDAAARELARTPENTRLLFLSAPFYRSHGDLKRSRELLEKVVTLSPRKQSFRYALAEQYIAEKDYDAALGEFTIARDLAPNNSDAKTLYALGLVLSRKSDEAVAYLEKEFGSRTIDDERLARAYISAERYDLALEATLFILEKHPKDNPELYSMLASIYYVLGKRSEAISVLEKLKEVFPDTAKQVDLWIAELRSNKKITPPVVR